MILIVILQLRDQKSLLTVLKSMESLADKGIFKNFWPQGSKKSKKQTDRGMGAKGLLHQYLFNKFKSL